jgi:hypothetical protein
MTWVINATEEVDRISQWRLIFAVCMVLTIISAIIVTMRLRIRAKARGMAADDWMATLSLAFAIVYSIICIVRKLHTSVGRSDSQGDPVFRRHSITGSGDSVDKFAA